MESKVTPQKTRARRTLASQRKQLNVRIESALYRALEVVARQEQRSVPQTARQLLEAGLRQRVHGAANIDDIPSQDIASLAAAGGAFDWLAEEPDIYDDTHGEPL